MVIDILISLAISNALIAPPPAAADVFFSTPNMATDKHIDYRSTERLPVNGDLVRPPRKIRDSLGVEVDAKAAAIVDVDSGVILWEKNADKRLPIASITKLMTAAVFLDHNPGWDKLKAFEGNENDVIGAKFTVGSGVSFTVKDMFYVMLTGSANNAARAIAHTTGLSDEDFVTAMNVKAAELGLTDSSFVEPTGLSHENISTAQDLAKLATYIFQNEDVRQATTIPEHKLKAANADEDRTVKATNKLLKTYLDEVPYNILAAKTGYTEEAGYCLVQETEMAGKGKVLVVVLNSSSENARATDMKALTNWAFENYEW